MAKHKRKYMADGQLPLPKQLDCETQNIDEIMGNKKALSGAFSSFNASEYKRQLDEKSLIDLQKECIDHGIWPGGHDQATLIGRLMQAHERYTLRYQSTKLKPKPTPRLTKEAAEILEGAKNRIR